MRMEELYNRITGAGRNGAGGGGPNKRNGGVGDVKLPGGITMKTNIVILAVIGLLSVITIVAFLLKIVVSSISNITGTLFPPYFLTGLALALTAIGFLFPSAGGRVLTALLAWKVGFISLKVERLVLTQWKAEGIVVESPSLGLITINSVKLVIDLTSRSVTIELSGIKVEISRSLRGGIKTRNASDTATMPTPKKRSSTKKQTWTSLGYLRFLRFLKINLDAVEVTYRNTTCKIRDYTATLRMGEKTSRNQSWDQLVLVHASMGMFTLIVSEDEAFLSKSGGSEIGSNANPAATTFTTAHSTATSLSASNPMMKDRLISSAEEDDLFPELSKSTPPNAPDPSPSLSERRRSLLESRQHQASVKFSMNRAPPLLELSRMSLWVHIPRATTASDLGAPTVDGVGMSASPGAILHFGAIKTFASSATLFNLFKLMSPPLDPLATPPPPPPQSPFSILAASPNPILSPLQASRVSPLPPVPPTHPREHPLNRILALLVQFRVDPMVFEVDHLGMDWSDNKGPCLSLGLALQCDIATRSGGLRLAVNHPALKAMGQTGTEKEAETIISLDTLSVGVVRAIADAKTSAAIVLNGTRCQLRSLDVAALGRAHLELLRLNRQIAKFKRQFPSQMAPTQPSPPTQPLVMMDSIELAVTNAIVMRLHSEHEPDLTMRLETLSGRLDVLSDESQVRLVVEDLAVKNAKDALVQFNELVIKVAITPSTLGTSHASSKRIEVSLSHLKGNVASAPAIRVYRLWRRFAPRLSLWRESSQALNLVTDAETLVPITTISLGGPIPFKTERETSTTAGQIETLSVKAEFLHTKVELFLVEDKGIVFEIPEVEAQRPANGSTEVTVSEMSIFGFDHRLVDQHERRFLFLQDAKAAVSMVSAKQVVDVGIKSIKVDVPSRQGPFPGELFTAYFAQRKALLFAVKEVQEDIPVTHAVAPQAGPFSSTMSVTIGAGSLTSEDFSGQLHHPHDGNHNNGPSSNAASSEPSADTLPDVEKLSLRLSIASFEVALEDDDVADDYRYAAMGFYDEKRRATPGSILRVTSQDIDVSFLVMTAWKSRAGPASDLSLLKRTQMRSQKTRAHLLKILAAIDSASCPISRLERALAHGMADIIGVELKHGLIGRTRIQLSDYPQPLMSVDCINLVSSANAVARIVLADLRAVPCSTKSISVELSEIRAGGGGSPIRVASTSSYIPVKVYYDFPSATCANLVMNQGENCNVALVALDRALVRLLPGSSDSLSPKLGWWDKARYMARGRLNLVATGGVDIRVLTGRSPFEEGDYVSFSASELEISDTGGTGGPPLTGVDIRCWELSAQDFVVKLSKKDCEDGRPVRFSHVPRLRYLLSFAWQSRAGGDHYVQLQHADAETPEQVGDQYAFFRSHGLDLGLDFECRRAMGTDYTSKEKFPSMELCWRVTYPLLCHVIRAMNPPVPPNPLTINNVTLGKLLTRVRFNVRADRPHILWFEDRSASLGFLLRGKTVDSRVVFVKTIVEGSPPGSAVVVGGRSSPPVAKPAQTIKWVHDAVLAQFVAVEGYMMPRYKPGGGSSSFGDEFGLGDGYAFGIGLPHEPFCCAPAMRITLGKWTSLMSTVQDDSEDEQASEEEEFESTGKAGFFQTNAKTSPRKAKSEEEGEGDSKLAYRLCVDEARIVWTLQVRDETFRFFGTVTYIIRRETRVWSELASKFDPQTEQQQAALGLMDKERIRRMDLSWLWNRPRPPVPRTSPLSALEIKYPSISARMAAFLSSREKLPPLVCEERVATSWVGDSKESGGGVQRERPPACSNASISADGLKSTWDEICREYTLELRWPQVSLLSGRSVVVLATKSATIKTYRLGLLDLDEKSSLLLRKEMDVTVTDAEMYATTISEQTGTRFIKSKRPENEPLCLDPLMDYDTTFLTARGSVRRGTTPQSFTDRVTFLLSQTPKHTSQTHQVGSDALNGNISTKDEKTIIQEHRVKRCGQNFFDICSNDQDPTLDRVGWTANFRITDVVYTDTTGGAKVPCAHLGVRLEKSEASIKARDFFTVLVIVRDLLLVGPPADVRELAVLAEQEVLDELKRRYRQSQSKKEADATGEPEQQHDDAAQDITKEFSTTLPPKLIPQMSGASGSAPSDADLRLLKEYVEQVLATRERPKGPGIGSQRIIYELIECDWKLRDTVSNSSVTPGDATGGPNQPLPSTTSSSSASTTNASSMGTTGVKSSSMSTVAASKGASTTATIASLSATSAASQLAPMEKLRVQVFNMRGHHLFSVDRSTTVEFEIGNVKVLDLSTNQPIVECSLLDAQQLANVKTPFLRADAITSPPIVAYGCRISVYELIQVHLFPGARFCFKLKVAQPVASFIRKYLVEDDDARGGVADTTLHGGTSIDDLPSPSNTMSQRLLLPQQDKALIDASSASSVSIAKTSRSDASRQTNGGDGVGGAGNVTGAGTGGGSQPSSRMKKLWRMLKPSGASQDLSGGDRQLLQHRNSRGSAGGVGGGNTAENDDDDSDYEQQGGENLMEDEAGNNNNNNSSSTPPGNGGDGIGLGLDESTLSAILPPSSMAKTAPSPSTSARTLSVQAKTSTSSVSSSVVTASQPMTLTVRSGSVVRLSVPKSLQLHPEPTTQPWASTMKRKSILLLQVYKGEPILEVHNSEVAVKLKSLKIAARASIRLKDIYSIRRSVDPSAPSHTLDVFYTMNQHGTSAGGDGVFTWAAEEPGWQGRDAALPWVAALAPGLGRHVIEPSLQRELVGSSIESIYRRSYNVMRPKDGTEDTMLLMGASLVGPRRPLGPGDNGGGGAGEFGDNMTEEESDNSSPNAALTLLPVGVSPRSPTNATGGATAAGPAVTNAAKTFFGETNATNQQPPQQPLLDIAFFKFARIGQIEVDLSMQGFGTVIDLIQSTAVCAPTVYHRMLSTWYKSFKEIQKELTRKLLYTAVRGLGKTNAAANMATLAPVSSTIPEELEGNDEEDEEEEDDYLRNAAASSSSPNPSRRTSEGGLNSSFSVSTSATLKGSESHPQPSTSSWLKRPSGLFASRKASELGHDVTITSGPLAGVGGTASTARGRRGEAFASGVTGEDAAAAAVGGGGGGGKSNEDDTSKYDSLFGKNRYA